MVRAVTFKDWQAVLWMDVDRAAAAAIAVVLACEISEDLIVWKMAKLYKARYRMSSAFSAIHGQNHNLGDRSRASFIGKVMCLFPSLVPS